MNRSQDDALAADYLARLDRAAAALPADRREDLTDDIREHIEQARSDDDGSPVHLRTVLDRLGTPEDIVASAQDPATTRTAPAPVSTAVELCAVLLLTLGSVLLPMIGWAVGVALLWSSSLWTRRDKLLGTLVWPGGLGAALFLGVLWPTAVCTSSSEVLPDGTLVESPQTCEGVLMPVWLGIPFAVVLLAAPIVVSVVLLQRARRRAAA